MVKIIINNNGETIYFQKKKKLMEYCLPQSTRKSEDTKAPRRAL